MILSISELADRIVALFINYLQYLESNWSPISALSRVLKSFQRYDWRLNCLSRKHAHLEMNQLTLHFVICWNVFIECVCLRSQKSIYSREKFGAKSLLPCHIQKIGCFHWIGWGIGANLGLGIKWTINSDGNVSKS